MSHKRGYQQAYSQSQPRGRSDQFAYWGDFVRPWHDLKGACRIKPKVLRLERACATDGTGVNAR
jgi:hypothetical protein